MPKTKHSPWIGWYAEETGHVFVNTYRTPKNIEIIFRVFATVVTSTPAIFFNFQVKRDGRESNKATNLRLKHRLKEK